MKYDRTSNGVPEAWGGPDQHGPISCQSARVWDFASAGSKEVFRVNTGLIQDVRISYEWNGENQTGK